MAETISHTWQTVEQAAVMLNVSTRTIARRLATGSLESRVDENGRRLVLVQQVNAGPTAVDSDPEDNELAPLAESMMAGPADQTFTMMTVLQTTLTAARDDAHAARRTARWAWAGVGLMAGCLIAGAAIVSSVLTRSAVQTEMLGNQLAETKSELKQTQSELIATGKESATALAQAKFNAERQQQQQKTLDAVTVAAPKAVPATQPTLMDRMVSIFGN